MSNLYTGSSHSPYPRSWADLFGQVYLTQSLELLEIKHDELTSQVRFPAHSKWDCPIPNCTSSYILYQSLRSHLQRKHPSISLKSALFVANQRREEAVSVPEQRSSPHQRKISPHPHHYHPPPPRRTAKDLTELWPCMFPSCFKFYCSVKSLNAHQYRHHQGAILPYELFSIPKGSIHPLLEQQFEEYQHPSLPAVCLTLPETEKSEDVSLALQLE